MHFEGSKLHHDTFVRILVAEGNQRKEMLCRRCEGDGEYLPPPLEDKKKTGPGYGPVLVCWDLEDELQSHGQSAVPTVQLLLIQERRLGRIRITGGVNR